MTDEAEQALHFMFDVLEKVRGFTFTAEPVEGNQDYLRLRSVDSIRHLLPEHPYLACRIEDDDWYLYWDVDTHYRLVLASDKSVVFAWVARLDIKLDLTAWDSAIEQTKMMLRKMREMKQELVQYER